MSEVEKEIERIKRKLEEKLKEGAEILSSAGFEKYFPKCRYTKWSFGPLLELSKLSKGTTEGMFTISCGEGAIFELPRLYLEIYKHNDSWNIDFSNPKNYIVDGVNEIPYNRHFLPLLIEGEQNITRENDHLKVKRLDDFEKFIDKHGEKLIALYSASDRIGEEEGLSEWSNVDPEIGEKVLKIADGLIKIAEEYNDVNSEINEIEFEKERNIRRIIRNINKIDFEYKLVKRLIEE